MELFLVFSVVCLASALGVLVLVRRVLRLARRQVAAVADRARLTAHSYGAGPVAELARLRRDMDRALDGARRALAASRDVHAPVGDVPSLLARLELAARAVDGELRTLSAQPDRTRMLARLDGPRSRARVITESAAALVDGLVQAAGHEADELELLHAACTIEADALRAAARGRAAGQRPAPRAERD